MTLCPNIGGKMKKFLIVLTIAVCVILSVLLEVFSGSEKIKATLAEKDDITGKTQTSELQILYRDNLPAEMILEVSSDGQEILDTSYEVVKSIVDTVKLNNPKDTIALSKDEMSFILKVDVESEGFTYPKDFNQKQMKEYLEKQGWNIK